MPDPIHGVSTTDPVVPTSAGQTGAAASTETASASAPGASAADLADIAQTEALLQSIVQAANDSPNVDQAKVAELQQAIGSGTYQVNPQAIAEKLVELENLLVTAGQVQ
jgi:negative regulator of flagellin synthesis FlgM